MKIITIILIILIQLALAQDNYYYKNNQKQSLTPINVVNTKSLSKVKSTMDYYENENGIVLGVSDKLILKLNNEDNLQVYLDEFNITLKKILSKNLYLLKVEDKKSTIDISNRLRQKDDVEYAHPDFTKKRVRR